MIVSTSPDDVELNVAPPAKRAILQHSLRLFASRGVEAVSVRDIAAVTGFTNPALFKHFAGKDDLARALFETCYRRLVSALQAANGGDLEAWLGVAFDEIAREPEAVHFVLENVRLYWAKLPEELRGHNLPALTREMLDRQKAAGRIRDDLDTSLGALVVLGALGQVARSAFFAVEPAVAGVTAEALSRLLLKGLGPE